MPTSEIVASFTIVITKGGTYRRTFTFTDENDTPIDFTSLQVDVTPNIGDPFSWTQANGKFTIQSTGVYLLELSNTDTEAFEWTAGTYHFDAVLATSGDVDPCYISGLVFANNC